MRSRRKRSGRVYVIRPGVLLLLIVMAAIAGVWHWLAAESAVTAAVRPAVRREMSWLSWQTVLSAGIPGHSPGSSGSRGNAAADLLRQVIWLTFTIDTRDIRTLLQAEIPVLAALTAKTAALTGEKLPQLPGTEFIKTAAIDGKPLVGIYHTHTAESFIPSAGATHKPGGQQGDIVMVGRAMAVRLNKLGIGSIQSATVHDYPSFMKAYGVSEQTVKKMLAENPALQMMFDIHRDAEKRDNYIATVDGQTVARIMIIVATGQTDLVQPHWQQNYAFAKLLDERLNRRYPGVSRGIRLDDFRYNQHLHPRLLLLEVGCQENTREEAERGIELLAEVIADILLEKS